MTVYYNDNDDYCCRVLRSRISDGHLPCGIVDNRDVREIRADELLQYTQIHLYAGIGGLPLALSWTDFGRDRSIITAGFPCTDISCSGLGKGLQGKQSGLWWETLGAISVVRPEFVFVENVSAILAKGVDVVLGSLAQIGYSCEYHCIPASHVGAPHKRDRFWLLAHSNSKRGCMWNPKWEDAEDAGKSPKSKGAGTWDTLCRLGRTGDGIPLGVHECGGWECGVPRVAVGQKNRIKRLKALGNSVVPQCAFYFLDNVFRKTRGDIWYGKGKEEKVLHNQRTYS